MLKGALDSLLYHLRLTAINWPGKGSKEALWTAGCVAAVSVGCCDRKRAESTIFAPILQKSPIQLFSLATLPKPKENPNFVTDCSPEGALAHGHLTSEAKPIVTCLLTGKITS